MMKNSKVYRLVFFCIVCQGCFCYPCHNGSCSLCPNTCVSCESESYCNECKPGFYGGVCSEVCKSYCESNTCLKFSGLCDSCGYGFFLRRDYVCVRCPENCFGCTSNDSCSTCLTGFKGDRCDKHCLNCKPGTPCDKNTGICNECNDGLSGQSCDVKCNLKCKTCKRLEPDDCISCSNDRYGEDCDYECSSTCINTTCNETHGTCTHGCSRGYWGDTCDNSCATYCNRSLCNRIDGSCVNVERTLLVQKFDLSPKYVAVIIAGGLGVVMVLAAVVYLKKRRFNSSTRQRGETTNETEFEQRSEDELRRERMHPIPSPDEPPEAATNETEFEQRSEDELRRERMHPIPYPDEPPQAATGEPLEDRQKYEKLNQTAHIPEGRKRDYQVLLPEEKIEAGTESATTRRVGQGLCAYFIDDINRAKAYLACKDPRTKHDTTEFWKTVWNERCDIIIMLTGTDEESSRNIYCPELNTKEVCGDISVKTVGVLYKGKSIRRTIIVKQNNEKRQVFQVQWHRSTPLNVEKLIEFRAWVLLNESVLFGPLLIHSRDGASICGQYIALDMFLKQRKMVHTVTMFDCIDHLRKQNSNLLKDDDEIAVLYKAVTCRPQKNDDTDAYQYIDIDHLDNN